MLKSLVVTLFVSSMAIGSFAVMAQAQRWSCPMPMTKGGCPVVVSHPGPQPTYPNGN